MWAIFVMAAATFPILLRFTAPYGRHYRGRGWGPHIANRAGWIVMELPATVLFLYVYCLGQHAWQPVPLVFLGMWQVHYVNRTFVYPFRTRTAGKKVPVLVVGSGFLFNVINAYVNARFISHIAHYLGELLEWAGWALATWSLGGLAFFVYTVANLVPRARSNHGWYRGRFENYPAGRRAVIPGVI